MESDLITALREQLSQYKRENEAILQERDNFRSEVKAFRRKFSDLESHAEDLDMKNKDLKRKLSRIEVKRTALVGGFTLFTD